MTTLYASHVIFDFDAACVQVDLIIEAYIISNYSHTYLDCYDRYKENLHINM